jgi:galactokinase
VNIRVDSWLLFPEFYMIGSESRQHRIRRLQDRFRTLYGDDPHGLLRAPARINVLGEHVDYVSYLPTASLFFGSGEHEMLMAFRATDQPQVRGASTNADFEPFTFTLTEVPGADWDAWVCEQKPAPHWSNYVKGAILFARHQSGERVSHGFDFIVDSTIPPKGGASSSSALTVLAGAAIRSVNQIGYEPRALARASSRAEWYVGTRGGALDHTAICLAQAHHAVHLNYATDQTELVPLLDDRFRWLTFFAHEADKGREVMLAYNERAAVARLLIPALIDGAMNSSDDLRKTLAQAPETITLQEIERSYPAVFAECQRMFPALLAARGALPLKLRDRALHHFSEAQRVIAAVRLLNDESNAETIAAQLGELLNAAHASLRDLYEVSTPLVNQLTEIILADPQVYGARLMGGGFGGNVLALTTAENAPDLIHRAQSEFYRPQQRDGLREGAVMISTPGDGLSEISLTA